ncbi:MAG: hypothetical protein ACOYD7_00505 [Raoultibacter sp.]
MEFFRGTRADSLRAPEDALVFGAFVLVFTAVLFGLVLEDVVFVDEEKLALVRFEAFLP